jgi:[acyl-carrier-protein] S-malonyltransferase
MFPGQGSQSSGMGRECLKANGVARRVFEEADDILGWSVSTLCSSGAEHELNLTEKAQPALLTMSVAIWRDLQEKVGLSPDVCLGHSAGEYAALVAAGAIEFADALRCIARRGEFMAAASDGVGGMVAVLGLPVESVEAICKQVRDSEVLEVANLNAPGQVVISGHNPALARAETALRGAGARRVVRLRISVPCHCMLMQPASIRLAEVLAGVKFSAPLVPVLSNVTALPHGGPDSIRARLTEQISHPVRWEECVRWALKHGCRWFAELGPSGVLTGLLRRIDRSVEGRWFDRPVTAGRLTDLFQPTAAAGGT